MERDYDYEVMFAFENGLFNGSQIHDVNVVEGLWGHYVPHFPATIRFQPDPYSIFANQAAENIVGKTFTFAGVQVRVIEAWTEDGDLLLTIDKEQP